MNQSVIQILFFSAVMDFQPNLESKFYAVVDNPTNLMFFSDSCSGQNRHKGIMYTLAHFISKTHVFNKVHHVFSVVGHSYLPLDRVFGNVVLHKTEIIVSPNNYHKIFEKFGHLKLYVRDWVCFNIETVAEQTLRVKLPFLTTQQKTV